MGFSLEAMLLILILTFAPSCLFAGPLTPCCNKKTVGNVSYTFVNSEDTSVASTYGCMSNCVYEQDDVPGSLFCFADGDLPTTCRGPKKILYIGSGEYAGTTEIFSISGEKDADSILTETSCSIEENARTIRSGEVEFEHGGTFYRCGGSDPNIAYSEYPYTNECFSLVNFKWMETKPMLYRRWGAGVVTLPNSTIFVTGGQNSSGTAKPMLDTTEMFDGTSWTRGPDMPVALTQHCMALLPDGDVLISGGWPNGRLDDSAIFGETAKTFVYSFKDGIWREKPSMSIQRVYHACAVLNGEVWVGGSGPHGQDYENDLVGSTEIYNHQTETWRPGPTLPYTVLIAGEFVSNEGRLFYIGGYGDSEGKQIHLLNDNQDGWIFVTNMKKYRYNFITLIMPESDCDGGSLTA